MCGIDSWALDTDETRQLRKQMVAALVEAGDIIDERWRQAFIAVPRHSLVPCYYRSDNYVEINVANGSDHSTWLRSVYSDETLITQKTAYTVTSSGTMPGLIALLLQAPGRTRSSSGASGGYRHGLHSSPVVRAPEL